MNEIPSIEGEIQAIVAKDTPVMAKENALKERRKYYAALCALPLPFVLDDAGRL